MVVGFAIVVPITPASPPSLRPIRRVCVDELATLEFEAGEEVDSISLDKLNARATERCERSKRSLVQIYAEAQARGPLAPEYRPAAKVRLDVGVMRRH